MEETRIVGQLPTMTVEISHDQAPDGSGERLTLRLTATPDFQSAHGLARQFGPAALFALGAGNGAAANPFQAWTDLMTSLWAGPMKGLNAFAAWPTLCGKRENS